MRTLAFDTETALVAPGRVAPPMACLTWADDSGAGIDNPDTGLRRIRDALRDSDTCIVGANVSFDMGVIAQRDPSLLPLIFAAYDAGRVGCTQVLSKLQYIAGVHPSQQHSLADVAKRHLGVRMTGKSGPDAWRFHYRKLIGTGVDSWPTAARDYAINDAILTRDAWNAQSKQMVPDLVPQVAADWSLQTMGAWGVAVDPESVYELDARIRPPVEEAIEYLKTVGIYRADGSQDRKRVVALVTEAYNGRPPRGEPTKKMLAKGVTLGNVLYDADTLRASGHPDLITLAKMSKDQKELSSFLPMLLEAARLGLPLAPYWNVLVNTGRTSCSKPNLQNLPRRAGVREALCPRPGNIFFGADYSVAELKSLAQVLYNQIGDNAMLRACNAGMDLHILTSSQIDGCSYDEMYKRYKDGDPAAKNLRNLSKACFHPDTEVMTRKGWRRIADLSEGEEVLSAQPDDTTGEVRVLWEQPLRLTERDSPVGELVHLQNEGIDLRVTPDHRMLAFRQNGTHKVVMPEDLGGCRAWKNAGTFLDGTWAPDPRILRLAVAAQADGHYTPGGLVRYGFTKQRKIDRLRGLAAGNCTEALHANGESPKAVTSITLSAVLSSRVRALLDGEKRIPWTWLDLTPSAREVVLTEVRHWDGHKAHNWKQCRYSSTDRQSVDVVQALATMGGRKTRLVEWDDPRGNRKRLYSLSVKDHAHTRGGNLRTTRIPYKGKVVCLSVPSTFIIARDGGIPVAVGQCNFGYPGGMGPAAMAESAAGYGVTITEQEAKDLKTVWLNTYPEMHGYFERLSRQAAGGWFMMEQHYSGRMRDKCTYTSGANTLFQGLTADGVKRAMYEICRRQMTDRSSALYGTRMNAVIHDEFLCEGPEDQCPEAADEMAQIMVEQMGVVSPDVKHEADPFLMRRWTKGAKEARDANGRLIITA